MAAAIGGSPRRFLPRGGRGERGGAFAPARSARRCPNRRRRAAPSLLGFRRARRKERERARERAARVGSEMWRVRGAWVPSLTRGKGGIVATVARPRHAVHCSEVRDDHFAKPPCFLSSSLFSALFFSVISCFPPSNQIQILWKLVENSHLPQWTSGRNLNSFG